MTDELIPYREGRPITDSTEVDTIVEEEDDYSPDDWYENITIIVAGLILVAAFIYVCNR